MRKYLTVLALLTWIPSFWNPLWGQTPREGISSPQTSQTRANGATGQSGSNQIGTQASPLIVDTEGHIKTPDETANAEKEAKRTRDTERRTLDATEGSTRYAFWTMWGTWTLVIVGSFGIFAAILTLQQMKDQTAAAKANADAALLNAQAFINSDRARFCVERLSDFNLETPPEHGLLSGICVMVASYKNIGKSLCRVKEGRVRFHMVEKLEDLPPLPFYSKIDRTETTIPPNDTVTVWAPLEEHILTAGTIMALRSHKRFLCFYARIDYVDAHGQPRVFQSCYVFNCPLGMVVQGINDKEGFIVGGPPAYNTET